MRIAFFGTAPIARPILRALCDAGHQIGVVVTQPDRAKGRSKKLRPPPVKEEALALELSCEVFQPERMKRKKSRLHLQALGPFDLGVVCAYGQILTEQVLGVPRLGMVNVHASLLPRWRGAAPVQRAILAGDAVTGVTLMHMVKALDAGDMIAKRETAIGPLDTAPLLLERLGELGAALLIETIPALAAGSAPRTPQSEDLVTYAAPIQKAEGQIDWTQSAAAIDRHLRGLTPWPGSFTTRYAHADRDAPLRVVIEAARPATASDLSPEEAAALGEHPAGTIIAAGAQGLLVVCGKEQDRGALRVERVRPAGKGAMPAAAWHRGRKVEAFDRLGT